MAIKIATPLMHVVWRWTRGLTLGVQCCLIDQDNKVLLVRHGYRPGWHFPGGGVEKGETVGEALQRELEEEVAVTLNTAPELFSIFSNFKHFRGDHIIVFVCRQWTQTRAPEPNFEIAEIKSFDPGNLPPDIHPPTRARLREIFNNRPIEANWHVEGDV